MKRGNQIWVPKKTKKLEFGKTCMAILFEIKNNSYTPIISRLGVGEISKWNFWKL